MRTPWSRRKELKKRIEELEGELEKTREEKESYRERFEAEKERRSEVSRKKQQAEEKLKKLEQKRETKSSEDEEEEKDHSERKIGFEEASRILEKLSNYKSTGEDLITVYCPGKIEDFSASKDLKNSVSADNYSFLKGRKFAAFIDPDLLKIKIRTRPFFRESLEIGDRFEVSKLRNFIEREKEWAKVSAGKSIVLKEENGEILETERIGDRIDRKQKKGGFSQGRFERKRDEQVEEHLEKVRKKTSEDTLLVGEERLCKRLEGEYLGGFDETLDTVDALYGFRIESKDV